MGGSLHSDTEKTGPYREIAVTQPSLRRNIEGRRWRKNRGSALERYFPVGDRHQVMQGVTPCFRDLTKIPPAHHRLFKKKKKKKNWRHVLMFFFFIFAYCSIFSCQRKALFVTLFLAHFIRDRKQPQYATFIPQ